MTATYTRDQINAILSRSDAAVERAIIRLFELQESDEQAVAVTQHDNTVGFSAFDARAGTRFARWLLGMNDSNERVYPPKSLSHKRAMRIFGRYVTEADGDVMGRARRIALKHSRQLVELANGDLKVLNPMAA